MSDATIIDGKAIAAELTDRLAEQTKVFMEKSGVSPCLAVVLVGDDPASAVYVRNKGKTAGKVGFQSIQQTLPADTPEAELISIIEDLNNDPAVNGILVQLPLPDHIDEGKIIDLIAPEKDVDGISPGQCRPPWRRRF